MNKTEGAPCIFYFHPWEIDPEQPRIPGVSLKTRFRHYLNLGRMQDRLAAVLHASQIEVVPITTLSLWGQNLPCGGGGYFRLLPYAVSRWALRRVNKTEGAPCIFYFHPWEIDPEQPRIPGVSLKTRFRHYLNLGRMQDRLAAVLRDFHWYRMDDIFLENEETAR